jgi:hypothetical protein
MDRLFEDAEKWIRLRNILIQHVGEFGEFQAGYGDEHNNDDAERGALENLKETISDFEKHVSTRITQLYDKSLSLIQIVRTPILSNLSYQLRYAARISLVHPRLSADMVIGI